MDGGEGLLPWEPARSRDPDLPVEAVLAEDGVAPSSSVSAAPWGARRPRRHSL